MSVGPMPVANAPVAPYILVWESAPTTISPGAARPFHGGDAFRRDAGALGGGCELAMACDFRICTEKSIFGQPEVGLGITPGYSGTQRLPRLVGLGMAKQIIYTGDNIDAGEALRIGLVNKIVASEELMEKVKKMAKKISSRGQTAVRLSKVAINDGVQVDMDRGITIESDMFGLCFATEDQKEGMMAFAEKRKPNFSGK